MKKHLVHSILILLLLTAKPSFGQQKQNVNELKKQLATAVEDTTKFKILDRLTTDYLWYADQIDSAQFYVLAESGMAFKLNQPRYLAESYVNLDWYFMLRGNLEAAIGKFTIAAHLSEENKLYSTLIKAYQAFTVAYSNNGVGSLEQVIKYAKKAEKLIPYEKDTFFRMFIFSSSV